MTKPQIPTWRILHVDDDEDDHLIVRSMLNEARGRTVALEWSATLDDARRKLQSNHYQAVLVDYDLGVGSGIDLIREFVQRGYTAPLILLTGRGSYDVDVEAMHAGATLYLTKSEINPLLLERSIRYAIERKQSEAALHESEARFRDLANNISQLAWMADPSGAIFWYNQRWFDYTGETLQTMQGFGWRKVYHPDYVERVAEKFHRAIEAGEDWEDTFPLRGADGQYRWFLSRAVPICNANGSVRRWFGTNTDITDQLQLEEENHHHKDLLERLVQAAPVGIAFLKGPQHVYTLVNAEYIQLARGKGDLIGHSVAEIWPEIAAIVVPQMDRVYRTGEPFSIVDAPLRLIRDGEAEDSYLTYTFTPINRADGSIEGVMILAIDTTGIVRTRMALEEEAARMDAVLEALPVGVWIADQNGRLTHKNAQADRIWAGESPLLERIDEYTQYSARFPGSDRDLTPEEYPMARTLRTGQPVEPVEVQIQRFDGTLGNVLISAAPITDGEGHLTGAVAINVDVSIRKQVEQAMRASERGAIELAEALEVERAKLSAAIETLPVGVGIGDAQGNTLALNAAGLKLHGFSSEAEMFSRLDRYTQEFELRFLDGRLMPFDEWPAARAMRGDYVQDYELRLVKKRGGEECIVSYSVAPVLNMSGEVVLIVYVMQDMTERKKIEEALSRSEQRYRLAARATNDAIWDWDLVSDHIEWNEALSEIFGYPPSEQADSSGAWWKAHIHPEDRDFVAEHIRRVIDGNEGVWSASYRFRRADGAYAEVFDRGWVVRGENGRPLRMVGAMRDRDHWHTEVALRASEDRFRQLADAMPQLVWTANPDGAVDYYNRRYKFYGGIAPTQEGAWEWGPVLHPDDLQRTVDAWNEAVRSGNTYQIEHRVRLADGSYRWHLSRGIPAYDERGALIKWYGTATDVDDFKAVQADLAEYAERLQRSNEELENFAFVASHDLQEPLRKIQMFGDLLHRQIDGQISGSAADAAADYLGRMQNAASRMQAMISGLLELSRVSTRGQDFAPVDLTNLAGEVVSDLEARIRVTHGQVQVDPLPQVEGDALQLHRLLQNLVGNALKFNKPGTPPRVRISGHLEQTEKGPAAKIVVADNGIGFDPADAERLFQPFVRLHGRNQYDGSGMGLAICKKIVERHGGDITGASTPGEGSRFTVTLPVPG